MPKIPEYYIVGSEVGTGTVEMLSDAPPLEVLGVRLVLKPMDTDEDDTFAIVGVLGREDIDVLIGKMQEESEKVRYIAEQVPAESDKEGNDGIA